MSVPEVLLTTCRNSKQWSACLWDYSTGSTVHYYKNGGIVAPKTLNLIGDDYLLSADEDKPMTHIWLANSQEPEKTMANILPDKVTVMTLCPSSKYLAVGIGTRLYIWQLGSGQLLTIQKKNFQPITCVKFSSDGSFVIVTGQDGLLIVYDFESLVNLRNNYMSQTEGQVEPIYTKQDHSLPITDIHVGIFGQKSRLVTVSSDNTCKLYILSTGQLLLNLVFEEPLTSVIFDGPCWNLFVGRNSGKIQQFFLKEPPRGVDHHINQDLVFQGHEKRVTCLDLGINNGVLFSGSEDNFVFVWEIASRQILRRIEHIGAITNIKCVLRHENFFAQNFKVRCVVKSLNRDLVRTEQFVLGKIQDFEIDSSDDDVFDTKLDDSYETRSARELKAENAKLKAANAQLFESAMKLIQKRDNF